MELSELTSKFQFKNFTIHQNDKVMKVCTDSCLLGALAEPLDASSILDIGTGTGLLSLMISEKTAARIDAVDIDDEAVKIARHNIALSPASKRVTVFNEDIQDFAFRSIGDYDFIICNPPFYFNRVPCPEKSKNIHRHSLTLNQTQLIKAVMLMLSKPSGKFWVLLPPAETEHFERLAMQTRLYPQLRYFIRDRYDTPVIRVVTCFGYERAYMLSEEIIIRSPDGKYTGPTHRLLSRYYKHL